jgi:hypothetical protein
VASFWNDPDPRQPGRWCFGTVRTYMRRSGVLEVMYDNEKAVVKENLNLDEAPVFYSLDAAFGRSASAGSRGQQPDVDLKVTAKATEIPKSGGAGRWPKPVHTPPPATAGPKASSKGAAVGRGRQPLASVGAPDRPTAKGAAVADAALGASPATPAPAGLRVLRPRTVQPQREPSPTTSDEDRAAIARRSSTRVVLKSRAASAPPNQEGTAIEVSGKRATAELLLALKSKGAAALARVAVLWNVEDDEGMPQPMWYPFDRLSLAPIRLQRPAANR